MVIVLFVEACCCDPWMQIMSQIQQEAAQYSVCWQALNIITLSNTEYVSMFTII